MNDHSTLGLNSVFEPVYLKSKKIPTNAIPNPIEASKYGRPTYHIRPMRHITSGGFRKQVRKTNIGLKMPNYLYGHRQDYAYPGNNTRNSATADKQRVSSAYMRS